jgi:hypothetical protein
LRIHGPYKLNRNIRKKGRQELVTAEAVVTSSELTPCYYRNSFIDDDDGV